MKIGKYIGLGVIVAVALVGGWYTVASLEKVNQGEVGVVYSLKGGVEDEVLNPGWHFLTPWKTVKTYPISQQQIVFSNDPADYNAKEHDDWHIDAPADGGTVKLNLTVNYNFASDRVLDLYEKFNGMDGDTIVESMVQNSIIAYVKEVTPQFTVMEIYSDAKADVNNALTEHLNEKLSTEYGINVSSALVIDVELDETLMEKIQAKEAAKQDAEKAELDKQTALAEAEVTKANAEAEAEVQRIEAEAAAEVTRIKAEAEASKITIKSEAEAAANKLIAESLTDELLESEKISQWDGSLPVVSGDTNTILDTSAIVENATETETE